MTTCPSTSSCAGNSPGDELEPDNPEAIAATGFIVAGTHAVLGDNLMEEERIRERFNELDDMIATTGVGNARD